MPVKHYYYEAPCSKDSFARPEPLLIGISILNQLFAIVVHPDDGIHSLADWEERLAQEGSTIWSAGEKIPVSVLLKNIHNLGPRRIHNPNQMMVRNNGKQVVQWSKDLYIYRFIMDGEYCIRHESDYDVMSKVYSAYL